MANWLVNLNYDGKIEIWENSFRNGKAALGWDSADDSQAASNAFSYFSAMQPGDNVVAFLKGKRIAAWVRLRRSLM